MADSGDTPLRKIAGGTIIAMLGIAAALLLGFVTRLLIARSGTESQYGIYSLAMVVLNVLVVIATLGLDSGATRYAAFYRGKGDSERVKRIIVASVRYALIAGVLLSVTLLLASGAISKNLFHKPELVTPLMILAVGIPFVASITVLASVFRGFGRMQEKVYFQDLLPGVLFLLLLLPVLLFGLSFTGVFYAYSVSLILSGAIFGAYALRRLRQPWKSTPRSSVAPIDRELLLFCLPLLGVAILQLVMSYADSLLLGYFKAADAVGLYNAASPLAAFLGLPVGAMTLIYAPVAANLYGQGRSAETGRDYAILTKWSLSITLPLFLLLALFPEAVVGSLFGSNYTPASPALRVLSLGYIVSNLLGPSATLLMVVGETRFLMWAGLGAAALNVVLNIALIPSLGIVGAATATAASLVALSAVRLVRLRSLLGAHPLTKNLVKPAVVTIALALAAYFLVGSSFSITLWTLPVVLAALYALHLAVILLSRSLDQEDIALLQEIDRRVGVDTSRLRRALARWAQ